MDVVSSSLPAFTKQPAGISFAKEGAIFEFNFNSQAKPIRIVFQQYDIIYWDQECVVKVNGQVFSFTPSSIADFDAKIKAESTLDLLVAVTWTDAQIFVTAKSLAVKMLYVHLSGCQASVELDSNLSASVYLNFNDSPLSTLYVHPVNGLYHTNVAGLLPAIMPELPSDNMLLDYPHKYQIHPKLSGAEVLPSSNECYGFATVRPRALRGSVDFKSPMVNLNHNICQPGQRVLVHFLCEKQGRYSCLTRIVKTNDETRAIIGEFSATTVKTASFIVTLPKEECVVEAWIENDGLKTGQSVYYYVMPAVQQQRILLIRNLFGLYESVVTLLPASTSFDFETEQLLLGDGAIGVKNSNVDETYDLSVDMLSIANARMLAAMLAVHGQFLLADPDWSNQYPCVLTSKTIESMDENEQMQSLKLKFKVG